MNEFDEPISFDLDTSSFQSGLGEMVRASRSATTEIRRALSGINSELQSTGQTAVATGNQMGTALTQAFRSATLGGQKFSSVLKGLGLNLSRLALNAALKPVEGLSSSFFSSILGSILPSAKGNAFISGRVQAFANGAALSQGIVSQPTSFPLAGGRLGLMGEAGPEAILPLSRDASGRLGVHTSGGGSISVTMNITSPDAESFRRSEGQVSAMLARAVGRGQRNL